MTVSELIAKLRLMNPDQKVEIFDIDNQVSWEIVNVGSDVDTTFVEFNYTDVD